MIRYILKYKWYVLFILLLIILEPSVSSFLYFWLDKMYNEVQIGTDKLFIIRALTIGIMVWVLKRLLSFTVKIIRSKFICHIKRDVKHDIFMNVMGLNTANISEFAASGEYISAFTNDIHIIEQRFFSNIIDLLMAIFSLLILGSSFLALNPVLGFLVLAFGVTVMFIPPLFSKRLGGKNLVYSNNLSKLTQKLKEYFHAYPTIKNYSIEHEIEGKFNCTNEEVEDSKFEADYTLSLADSVGNTLSWFMQIIVIGAGLVMVSQGQILLGTVVAALSFAGDLATPLNGMVENINSIRSVKEIVNKINGLTTVTEQESEPSGKVDQLVNAEKVDIHFNDLTISMQDKHIVNHFSFKFESGKKYLIVGKNGAGKSSIFKALKKRFNSYSGDITINDINTKDLTNLEISKVVSYLNENVALFSGTVNDNVSLFRPYKDEEYDKAVKDAQMVLSSDRVINEDGVNISSGEQRRIEIARSLLSKARVMIFDEVVSTLDIETAYEIEKMVLEYEKQTMIFISHNFSGKLIHEYDEILVMDSGRLVDHGTYDELIKNSSYFRNICEIKFGKLDD